jgi:hypothetical protein
MVFNLHSDTLQFMSHVTVKLYTLYIKDKVMMQCSFEIMRFQITKAMNYRAVTCCINVNYVGHEWVSSLLFLFTVSTLHWQYYSVNMWSVEYYIVTWLSDYKWEDSSVLTMVYHNENQWVSELSPSSGILGNRKHDVSETGSVSVLRCGGEKSPTQLGPLDRASPVIEINLMSEETVRRWWRMFKDGWINVHNEERSGRLSVVSDDLVKSVDQKICERPRFTISDVLREFPQNFTHCSLWDYQS